MKKIIYCIVCFFVSLLLADEPVTYGWNIPNTPVLVGGYIDVMYDENKEDTFFVDDIALLFSANQNHFDMLGEVEISHLSLEGKRSNATTEINLERLQIGYAFSDEDHITLGRFNSDIGYWNQAPINILQDTTTEPHMIKHVFPKATTGFMYQNYFNDEDSFSVTVQHNNDFGQADHSVVVDRHISLGYHQVHNEFSWRMAGGFYRESTGIEAHYFGLGGEYDKDEFSVQAELFTQKSEEGYNKPYSAYVQSVWHFACKQDMVLRLERYNDEALGVNEGISLLGYVYRPWANMALKGEYVHHTELPLNRFVYSFSVMF
ncbi:hypothetical protein KKC13_10940 [bacterium]|nr:hypothetical protein [bacterium]MBU1958189.1 hypothetical protein [bacterium]